MSILGIPLFAQRLGVASPTASRSSVINVPEQTLGGPENELDTFAHKVGARRPSKSRGEESKPELGKMKDKDAAGQIGSTISYRPPNNDPLPPGVIANPTVADNRAAAGLNAPPPSGAEASPDAGIPLEYQLAYKAGRDQPNDEDRRAAAAAQGGGPAQAGALGFPDNPQTAPAMPPPQYARAHWDPNLDPYQPETRAARDKVIQAQEDADVASLRAQQKGADALTELYAAHERDQKDQRAQYEYHEQMRQGRFDSARALADQKAEEAANYRTDPFRMLRGANVGTQIMIGMGGAIGGMLQGLQGGENQFLKTIDGIIQRDIDAQKDELSSKRYGADMAKGALGELRQQLGSERAAELTLQDMTYAALETKLKEQLARTQSDSTQANIQRLIADTGGKRVGIQEQRDLAMRVGAHFIGGSTASKEDAELYVPRMRGRARTKDEAKDLRSRGAAYGSLDSVVGQIQVLRRQGANMTAEGRARIQSLTQQAIPIWMEAHGLKRLTEEDKATFRESVGDTTAVLPVYSGRADAALDAFRTQNANEEQEIYQAGGGVKAQEGYRVNPATGQVQQTDQLTGEDYKRGIINGRNVGMPSGAKKVGAP